MLDYSQNLLGSFLQVLIIIELQFEKELIEVLNRQYIETNFLPTHSFYLVQDFL
mgnify:FL=1